MIFRTNPTSPVLPLSRQSHDTLSSHSGKGEYPIMNVRVEVDGKEEGHVGDGDGPRDPGHWGPGGEMGRIPGSDP